MLTNVIRITWQVLMLSAVLVAPARAQETIPFSVVQLVSAPAAVPAFADSVPVTTAGDYIVTVTDFGVMGGAVMPVDSLTVFGVTAEGAVAFTSTAPGDTAATLPAGDLQLYVTATPAAGSTIASIGVSIAPAGGGTALYDVVAPLNGFVPPTNPTAGEYTADISTAGDYTFSLVDQAFPDAVASLQGIVLSGSGSVLGLLNGVDPLTVSLAANSSVAVQVVTTRGSDADRATIALRLVRDADGALLVDERAEIGDFSEVATLLPTALPTMVPLTLTVTDFAFPSGALGSLRAAFSVDGEILAVATPTAPASVTVPAGATAAVAIAADPGALGSAGVVIEDATSTVFESLVALQPVTDTNEVALVERRFNVPAAGTVTLTVNDFAVPAAFDAVSAIVVRDGATVITLNAEGVADFEATPGEYFLSAFGSFAATGSSGVLGVSVTDAADAALVEASAAAGGQLQALQVTVTTSDTVTVTLQDLLVPAAFEAFNAIVTRGASLEGQALGGGEFTLDVVPGTYDINVISTPDAAGGYSTYRAAVAPLPDPPAVTLTSDVASVVPGGSVTLTWSAERASSCTASGDWSGARGMTGSETISNLQANSSFRLDCTGPGGSEAAVASVTITAGQSSGGGGAWPLSMLFLMVSLAARRRRTVTQR